MEYEEMKANQDEPGEWFLGRAPVDGAYCRAEAVSERERDSRKRYTVFAFFPEDKAALALDDDALLALAQGAGDEYVGTIEEVDVDASDSSDARIIAEVALRLYYQDGWRVIHVEERFGLYF